MPTFDQASGRTSGYTLLVLHHLREHGLGRSRGDALQRLDSETEFSEFSIFETTKGRRTQEGTMETSFIFQFIKAAS